jgi:hypothetical protein
MKARNAARVVVLSLAALASQAAPMRQARAQATAQDKAQANALFERALAEYKAQHYKESLPLFEASQAADPGVGTLLYIGECHRQLGRAASAWGAFKEAQLLARKLSDRREKVAAEKAADLEKKVSYVTIEVPADRRVDGLEVRLDGKPFPSALWGTSVPLDPGPHRLDLSAPGHAALGVELQIAPDGARVVERVPALKVADRADPGPARAPGAPGEASRAAPPEQAPGGSTREHPGGEVARPSGLRTVGYVLGGAGVLVGGVGGVLMLLARGDGATAVDRLDRGAYDDAKGKFTIGTIGAGLGAALAITGVALVVSSPSSPSAARVTIEPRVASGAGGVWLRGAF